MEPKIDYHYVTDEDMKKLLDAEWNKAIDAAIDVVAFEFGVAEELLKLKR